MKNIHYRLSDTLTITQKLRPQIIDGKASGLYEYYIGKKFIFGSLEPFTLKELMTMYCNGYFTPFIEEA